MGLKRKLCYSIMTMILSVSMTVNCAEMSNAQAVVQEGKDDSGEKEQQENGITIYRDLTFEETPEADTKGWIARIGDRADAKAALEQGSYVFQVKDPGKTDSDVQIVLPGMKVKKADYTVKVWAKSTKETYCHLIARNEEAEGWDTFGGEYNLRIGEEIAPMTLHFGCEQEGSCELLFNCGRISPNPDNPEDTTPQDFTVMIDKIEIYETTAGQSGESKTTKKLFSFAPIGKGSAHEGDENFPVMTFNGTDEDNEQGVGTIWQENGSLFYRIDQGGMTDWHNKLVFGYGGTPLNLEAGHDYIIQIDAKATKDVNCGVYLNPIGGWNPIVSSKMELTGTEQTFTYETSQPLEKDCNVELLLQFGSKETAQNGEVTVEFTDVRIWQRTGTDDGEWRKELEEKEDSYDYRYCFLPKKQEGTQPYVGDPMAYYEDGVYYLYYLKDGGDSYNHSVYVATTKEFLNYQEYENPVIEASKDGQDSWIGTGSVVRIKDKYYFFYTGHADKESYEYKEKIMLAVGDDPLHFRKVEGWEMIPPAQLGQKRDFRDPQVYYDESRDCLYMTVTAAMDGVARILKYTLSSDLSKVNYEGVLFTDPTGKFWNLECSDFFRIGGKWYLTYSAQDDTLWYAVAEERFGEYSAPSRLDGKLFYAAKHVSDGKNHYMAGWVRRSQSPASTKEVSAWAGNLLVQQLEQREDGSLVLKPADTIRQSFDKPEKLLQAPDTCELDSTSGYVYQDMFTAQERFLLTGRFTFKKEGDFGLAFAFGDSKSRDKMITISPKKGKIQLSFDGSITQIAQKEVELLPDREYSFTYFQEGSVGTFYVDGEAALTVRIYGVTGKPVRLFCENNHVVFTQLQQFSASQKANSDSGKDENDEKNDPKTEQVPKNEKPDKTDLTQPVKPVAKQMFQKTVKIKALTWKKALSVSWKKVKNATSYEIYVSSSKNGRYTKAATVSAGKTKATIKKWKGKRLKPRKTYWVTVIAKTSSGTDSTTFKTYSTKKPKKAVKIKKIKGLKMDDC